MLSKLFRNKKFLTYLIIFILGVIVTASYCLPKLTELKKNLASSEKSEERLKEHIRNLSEIYRNPVTPTPAMIDFSSSKFSPREKNYYHLDCYNPNAETLSTSIINRIRDNIGESKNIVDVCFNDTLNQIVYLTEKDLDKGGMGRPGIKEITMKLFKISSKESFDLFAKSGSYLGGLCGKITAWSSDLNQNYIYINCSGGDGPFASSITYKISPDTKDLLIVEHCASVEEKTQCQRYCSKEVTCQTGYFCNLGQNNCVKQCKNWSDCLNGSYSSCQPFGPVEGCVL